MTDKPTEEKTKQSKSPKKRADGKLKKFRGPRVPEQIHGVVYIGHLSDGFYEPQIREYFKQFGEVKQLRLSRSKRTGGSKGYGFVQFESDEVAKIVADTMSGYAMFKKNMTCQHLPAEKVHPDVFQGARRAFGKPKAHVFARNRHNKVLTAGKEKAAVKKQKDKLNKRIEKLQKLGVNYSLPELSSKVDVIGKETSS